MARARMRMAELVRASGVPRETIHYYLREGLLPPPERSGKTSALYDQTHLERLRLIRRLRDEKYLPVAVIRSILQAGLEAPTGADLETLADVLAIDPTLSAPPPVGRALDERASAAAVALGLGLPPDPAEDPTAGRVLAAVGEALGLDDEARALTLEDVRVSAPAVAGLVQAEAAAFLDWVIERGEMRQAVRALRAGRGAVAHFLTAYRDWMLRQIVEDLVLSVREGSGLVSRSRALPLGAARLDTLGAEAHREALAARVRDADPAAANDLVWHLFALGLGRTLGELPPGVMELLRPRAELLVAHARAERGSDPGPAEAIAERAGAFPLGEVLIAELGLARALVSEGAVLERAIPALHRLYATDPGHDADPLASALAFLHRGLVGLALPRAFGRRARAESDLEQALGVLLSAPGRVHPAAAARIEGNARLGLARSLSQSGRAAEGRQHLARAFELDPAGPIGHAASALLEGPVDTEMLAGLGARG